MAKQAALLVQYPDSDSDEADGKGGFAAQGTNNSALKRKRPESTPRDLPPLPPAFHDLYAGNARVSTSDDPSLHGGRKRAVPHIEGNWPTHIYLEWIPSQIDSDRLHSLIEHVKSTIEHHDATRKKKGPVPDITSSLRSELGASLPLHVSLSRTLQIKTEDRDAFLEALKASLRRATVQSFDFDFIGLKWVSNFERNRWFLVLSIKKPERDELNRLLIACNGAVENCGHSGLYTGGEGDGPMATNYPNHGSKRRKSQHNQSGETKRVDYSEFFHISIAWNLTEPDAELTSLVECIAIDNSIQLPQAAFDAVKVRIGNVVHKVDLVAKRPKVGNTAGLTGSGLFA